MAKMDRDPVSTGPIVTGFAGSGFRVGEIVYPHGLLLAPSWARAWRAPALEALDVADLADLLSSEPAPEFLLIGTGPTMRRPSPALASAIEALGIGVEPMDSRAAARAWGILRAEDRWIVGALLPL